MSTCGDKNKGYDTYTNTSTTYLGGNMWDKAVSEFKMDYLDLDALLNGSDEVPRKVEYTEISTNEKVPHHYQHHHHHHYHHHHHIPTQDASNHIPGVHSSRRMSSQPPSPNDSSFPEISKDRENRTLYSVDCKFSPTDLALATPPGHEHYDPASTIFPDEELKPQPIIKKSRKNFVPDNMKDDKYWARRHKNNIAAKRSREARRLKENQIVLRASYLEKENNSLKEDVMRLKAENDMLRNQLKEFQS